MLQDLIDSNIKYYLSTKYSMKWEMKIQKLGRIQLPTDFMKAYSHKEGQKVLLEDSKEGKIMTIRFKGVEKK